MEILLVEDNLLNQKVVVFNLRKNNYNVTAVTNGDDALLRYNEKKFDLILMDIMLPEMDGYEITIKIRELENKRGVIKKVPIIALTANALDNDKDKCLQAGMTDYLSKPFTSLELNEMIEKYKG